MSAVSGDDERESVISIEGSCIIAAGGVVFASASRAGSSGSYSLGVDASGENGGVTSTLGSCIMGIHGVALSSSAICF